MVLLRHPRPAGFTALFMLGIAAAGPAFARTGLQSQYDEIPPQMVQLDSADTADMSAPSFDHGENAADRATDMGDAGHDLGGHDHGGGFGGSHSDGHGRR